MLGEFIVEPAMSCNPQLKFSERSVARGGLRAQLLRYRRADARQAGFDARASRPVRVKHRLVDGPTVTQRQQLAPSLGLSPAIPIEPADLLQHRVRKFRSRTTESAI